MTVMTQSDKYYSLSTKSSLNWKAAEQIGIRP